MRRPAMHFLFTIEHMAYCGRIPRADGQPGLWLRRLPRHLPWNKFAGQSAEAVCGATILPCRRWPFSILTMQLSVNGSGISGQADRRDRLLRNVLIACGNSGDKGLAPKVEALLLTPPPCKSHGCLGAWPIAGGREFHKFGKEDVGNEADLKCNRNGESRKALSAGRYDSSGRSSGSLVFLPGM